MKFDYIEPFVKATKNTFKQILSLGSEAGKPSPVVNRESFLDISTIIGLAGEVRGAVILSFTNEGALNISNKFTGIKSEKIDGTVVDAIGELVNIIAGNAKQGLLQYRIYISLPKIAEKNVQVVLPKDKKGALFVAIPFKTHLTSFNLILAISENK